MDTIALAQANWQQAGWSDAAEGMAAVTSVMRAQQILQARVDGALRPFGLTFARYEVLMLLHFSSHGSMPVKKASERLQVHPTTVTSSVNRLQAAGLVRRRPHPTDGRATLLELTDEGRALGLEATERLNASVFAAPGLDAKEVRSLIRVLRVLRVDAGDLDEDRRSARQ